MNKTFTKLAAAVARAAGKPVTFALCCVIVIAWAVAGPIFGFSDTWQLVINTGTTIVTFLMVFLIQNTQNRDGEALQTKLDDILELLGADDTIIGIEHLTDEEIEAVRKKIEARAKKAPKSAEASKQKPTAAAPAKRRGPAKSRGAARDSTA